MLEKLRQMLIDAGIDPEVGSMDYWSTELEGVLLNMYDKGAADEREVIKKLVEALEEMLRSYEFLKPPHYPISDSHKKAKAALAKANGETK